MEDQHLDLNVVDVYDLASGIGKEFEGMIDGYGPDSITQLMPQVIRCLEYLEVLAGKNQKENDEITELNLTIERLTAEKTAKAQDRIKYEKELESIEDSWGRETSELIQSVAELQNQNRRLRVALQENAGQVARHKSEYKVEEEEGKVLVKLKDTVDGQRKKMRKLKQELSTKSLDVEAMHSQLEHMARLTAEYRRKTTINQRQTVQLITDKTDLQAQLHEKEQQITWIRHRLERQSSSEYPVSPTSDDEILDARHAGDGTHPVADPDQPCFTFGELRDVLSERNVLKTKLFELEHDLQHYKKIADDEEADPAVQGPINKEPDEKLYPDRFTNSGIKKLFRFLFGPEPRGRRRSKPSPRKEAHGDAEHRSRPSRRDIEHRAGLL